VGPAHLLHWFCGSEALLLGVGRLETHRQSSRTVGGFKLLVQNLFWKICFSSGLMITIPGWSILPGFFMCILFYGAMRFSVIQLYKQGSQAEEGISCLWSSKGRVGTWMAYLGYNQSSCMPRRPWELALQWYPIHHVKSRIAKLELVFQGAQEPLPKVLREETMSKHRRLCFWDCLCLPVHWRNDFNCICGYVWVLSWQPSSLEYLTGILRIPVVQLLQVWFTALWRSLFFG
jgi:hypothetical protein